MAPIEGFLGVAGAPMDSDDEAAERYAAAGIPAGPERVCPMCRAGDCSGCTGAVDWHLGCQCDHPDLGKEAQPGG